MEKTIRVGMMPGKINEYAVETGATVAEVLTLAGLNASGYDVKVDGVKVDTSATIGDNTSLVMLVKRVKGNCEKTVRVGMMPGKINEFAVEIGMPIFELLKLASLDAAGYDVKVDGTKIDNTEAVTVTETTSLVMLVKRVKGNK